MQFLSRLCGLGCCWGKEQAASGCSLRRALKIQHQHPSQLATGLEESSQQHEDSKVAIHAASTMHQYTDPMAVSGSLSLTPHVQQGLESSESAIEKVDMWLPTSMQLCSYCSRGTVVRNLSSGLCKSTSAHSKAQDSVAWVELRPNGINKADIVSASLQRAQHTHFAVCTASHAAEDLIAQFGSKNACTTATQAQAPVECHARYWVPRSCTMSNQFNSTTSIGLEVVAEEDEHRIM